MTVKPVYRLGEYDREDVISQIEREGLIFTHWYKDLNHPLEAHWYDPEDDSNYYYFVYRCTKCHSVFAEYDDISSSLVEDENGNLECPYCK